MNFIYDNTFENLEKIVKEWGEQNFRTDQIWHGLYRNYWSSPDQFTTLSKQFQKEHFESLNFSTIQPEKTLISSDGSTEKILFRSIHGDAFETVLMKYPGKNTKKTRNTICVSTQVGCGMDCVFCATGKMGFTRNLRVGEIVEQVLFFARKLKDYRQRVTNVVYMGMGEPFLNYKSVLKSIKILNSSAGYNLGLRRFTISTVGLVPGMRRLAIDAPQVNLAVSLHAADDQLRDSLLPINAKYPLDVLMEACDEYVLKTNRRISFEWALIDTVNDSLNQAQKLVSLIKNFRNLEQGLSHVNLIQLNPTTNYKGNPSTNRKSILFKNELESNQISCTIRQRRGIDINAGCGQLATNA